MTICFCVVGVEVEVEEGSGEIVTIPASWQSRRKCFASARAILSAFAMAMGGVSLRSWIAASDDSAK